MLRTSGRLKIGSNSCWVLWRAGLRNISSLHTKSPNHPANADARASVVPCRGRRARARVLGTLGVIHFRPVSFEEGPMAQPMFVLVQFNVKDFPKYFEHYC